MSNGEGRCNVYKVQGVRCKGQGARWLSRFSPFTPHPSPLTLHPSSHPAGSRSASTPLPRSLAPSLPIPSNTLPQHIPPPNPAQRARVQGLRLRWGRCAASPGRGGCCASSRCHLRFASCAAGAEAGRGRRRTERWEFAGLQNSSQSCRSF